MKTTSQLAPHELESLFETWLVEEKMEPTIKHFNREDREMLFKIFAAGYEHSKPFVAVGSLNAGDLFRKITGSQVYLVMSGSRFDEEKEAVNAKGNRIHIDYARLVVKVVRDRDFFDAKQR